MDEFCGDTQSFNAKGNILITDQFNNRVIEVDPATNQIVWSFGSGNSIIADQFNHRVIIINEDGHILFQYGKTNSPGVGPNELYGPYTRT